MPKVKEKKIKTGISDKDREKVAEGLGQILADTYTLYLMTQNFHWNVRGLQFPILHKLFEEQYQELAMAVDSIAERIRALGFLAPATFAEFLALTAIKERPSSTDAHDMVQYLMEGHETVSRALRDVFPDAEEADDQATTDLIAGRIEVHEKAAWMLRSSLAKP